MLALMFAVGCSSVDATPSSPTTAAAGGGGARDGAADVSVASWRNCNGTDNPRSCRSADLQSYIPYRKCFDIKPTHVDDFCAICTLEYASASIDEVCGVDPNGNLYVVATRPDLRLEAPGWRFGHRRDRGVYRDLEPEALTASELQICEEAIAAVPGVDPHAKTCEPLPDAGGT